MAITSLANDTAFFIAFQGYGICLQKDESGQLVMIEPPLNSDENTAEFQLNRFRQRLMEYIESAEMTLNQLAVMTPLLNLMRRVSEKSGTDLPVQKESIEETMQKAVKAETESKNNIAAARDMMEEVLAFMLDNNLTVRQLDGTEIKNNMSGDLQDLFNKFKKSGPN